MHDFLVWLNDDDALSAEALLECLACSTTDERLESHGTFEFSF